MPNVDEDELEVVDAYERGELKSAATKSRLAKFKAAARATAVKNRRVTIPVRSDKKASKGTPK